MSASENLSPPLMQMSGYEKAKFRGCNCCRNLHCHAPNQSDLGRLQVKRDR